MKIIDKSSSKYATIIEVRNNEYYKIKTNELNDEEEIVCPNDSTMKVCKKDGKVFVKKTSRLKPF